MPLQIDPNDWKGGCIDKGNAFKEQREAAARLAKEREKAVAEAVEIVQSLDPVINSNPEVAKLLETVKAGEQTISAAVNTVNTSLKKINEKTIQAEASVSPTAKPYITPSLYNNPSLGLTHSRSRGSGCKRPSR